jgi:hypothetical protein
VFNDGFRRLAELAGCSVPHLFVSGKRVVEDHIRENFAAVIAALEDRKSSDCSCPCHDQTYRCVDGCCEGTLKGSA